tara:strand:+ start:228 stop:809 length:582 start_codon:yes stop_codon:yes gene_type:complete
MVDISNNNINSKMNILDKTTLYFLSNKTYLNKLNNNIINNNNHDNDLKNDFITYKKPIKNIINKLFEQYTTVDSDINNKKLNINEPNNKYEHAFYIFSKLCIQHIKSENINKQINSDLSGYSNFDNINLNIDNINIDNSNNSVYIDISYDTKNDDKILFINNTNNSNNSNNIKKFVDIKNKNLKKKILPRRIE